MRDVTPSISMMTRKKMKYDISDEDKVLIGKFQDILNRGRYADSRQVTDCYNRVFRTRLTPTNCSTCIRKRISQLYKALKSDENGQEQD